MTAPPSAVILLSGGLDSTTTLAVARDEGFVTHALTVDYGQHHAVELAAAHRVAKALGVHEHKILRLDLRLFGGSALTADLPVPKDRSEADIGEGIPVTYVPARNTIFLSLALGWAEVLGATDLFIGVSALDYSGYPDCRPAFVEAFEALANVATKQGVEGSRFHIHAPLLHRDKAETVSLGRRLGVDYGLTWTCYDPVEVGPSAPPLSCGRCDACQLRRAAFQRLGMEDPLPYAEPAEPLP